MNVKKLDKINITPFRRRLNLFRMMDPETTEEDEEKELILASVIYVLLAMLPVIIFLVWYYYFFNVSTISIIWHGLLR